MIFTEDEHSDVVTILAAIDAFIVSIENNDGLPVEGIDVDIYEVESLVRNMRNDFPYNGGYKGASTFKKLAVFIAFFMHSRPLRGIKFGDSHYLNEKHENHLTRYLNAEFVVRFMIFLLDGFTIHRADSELIVNSRIAITNHSYIDLVQTLGANSSDICPQRISLLALFIEQLVYKTNPQCQYSEFMYGDP
jgi:hypothetical protein